MFGKTIPGTSSVGTVASIGDAALSGSRNARPDRSAKIDAICLAFRFGERS
jgi:hypothetical protein